MAKVLGLSFFYHDSAAALVSDGHIVAAGAEERFCRRKHTNEFPKQAIEYCLEAADLRSINQLDAIVFYEKPVLKLNRIVESLVCAWPRGLATFTRRLPEFLASKFNVYRIIEKTLPGYQGPILFSQHHLSHAASAFYCSPFEEAAVLTMDGVGEWETTTLGVARDGNIRLHTAIHFPHSIGLLYSALTAYLGFRVNDGEWKVMGLAPYGEPTYVGKFRQLVRTKPDGSFQLDMRYFAHHYSSRSSTNDSRWKQLFGFPRRKPDEKLRQEHKDLARSGQAVVEELVLALAREARRVSGSKNLVIAGGVGLNAVANWKIEQEKIFENIWIQPAAGDDGGALGAALLVSREMFGDARTPPMTDAYMGPQFAEDEIEDFLTACAIPFEKLSDAQLIEETADLIADGKIIGWFRGRMEFGPRALGARSILADPTNSAMKDVINGKVKYREFFRPFAPAVPVERVHEYFEVEPQSSMPFMIKVPAVRPEARTLIPAVTHWDGTGRVQTVTRETNPVFYELLEAVERRKGVPVVLNTSFNVRGEPIVCTPQDAYACFLNTGLDALVLGNCLVTGKSRSKPERQQVAPVATEAGLSVESAANGASVAALRIPTMATSVTVTAPMTVSQAPASLPDFHETTERVLAFYKELPFNYYSNAVDTTLELLRKNQLKVYRPLHRYLRGRPSARVIDVGCGAGWFVNSCAHYYASAAVGVDLNSVALRQARSVARFMPRCDNVEFLERDVFTFEPEGRFDVVNSLGVLHSTPDCHGAIRRILDWIAPDGYLHLGLYHYYGRKPFLDHFAAMQRKGATYEELYEEFKRLNPDISDETHMLSWFRDQVLHPQETQHTHEELHGLLCDEGFVIEASSINNFKRLPPLEEIVKLEKACEEISRAALYKQRRYYPGFFSVWARRA